jgi:hypothetical protein
VIYSTAARDNDLNDQQLEAVFDHLRICLQYAEAELRRSGVLTMCAIQIVGRSVAGEQVFEVVAEDAAGVRRVAPVSFTTEDEAIDALDRGLIEPSLLWPEVPA